VLTLAAALGLGLIASQSAQAQTFKVLYKFKGGPDGANPNGGLIQDQQGNLYGTTQGGGVYKSGTVFKLNRAGKETVLYSFTGGTDGGTPTAGVVRDTAGNLYGTTYAGGAYNGGTVFELNDLGGETVLHSFLGGTDGLVPNGLLLDKSGNLFGTTFNGGDPNCDDGNGCGTVFKLDTAEQYAVLSSFIGAPDAAYPTAGVIQDPAGNLYGTTFMGGLYDEGAVFRLDTAGNESVLYYFFSNGLLPNAGLVQDATGRFYGTTWYGGTGCPPGGCGIVFRLTKAGRESVLYSFNGYPTDGFLPQVLILGSAGHLYGATQEGGHYACPIRGMKLGCGTIFELSPTSGGSWHETMLHSFTGKDGKAPSGLVRDKTGTLYGTAHGGGTSDNGVLFKLEP